MDADLTQLGVGGILAFLIIREVFGFAKWLLERNKNNKADKANGSVDLSLMAQWVRELHEWHSVCDQDGIKVWYVRRSLEEAIRELSQLIKAQTSALQELVSESRQTRRDVEKLADAS